MNPGTSGNSSFISVEEHSGLTTATLMQRDDPCRSVFDKDDVVSIQEDQQSDVEMVSIIEHPGLQTEDSSADSAVGDSDHHSNDSEMESNKDRGCSHHSGPDSDHNSNPRSNLGSESGSSSDLDSGSDSSDEKGGDFADMFKGKQKHSNTPQQMRALEAC